MEKQVNGKSYGAFDRFCVWFVEHLLGIRFYPPEIYEAEDFAGSTIRHTAPIEAHPNQGSEIGVG